jgi:hypothetical protein
VIRQYAALMMGGVALPPVTVWFDGDNYWLTDGFHRIASAEQLGYREIQAAIRLGSLSDAQWDSYSANSHHGLRRSRRRFELLSPSRFNTLKPQS